MVSLANNLIMSGRLIWSFRHLKHQNLPTGNEFIHQGSITMAKICIRGVVVPLLATREAVALLSNDHIMSERSIRSFRHLKHQNLSTSDDFIHRSGIFCLDLFSATKEVLALLANDLIMSGTSIWSFRHLKHQNMLTSDDFI